RSALRPTPEEIFVARATLAARSISWSGATPSHRDNRHYFCQCVPFGVSGKADSMFEQVRRARLAWWEERQMPVQGSLKDIPRLGGKRKIVTGGNSGIGWHTALELARAGAIVTVAARSPAKSQEAIHRIKQVVTQAELHPGVIDLSDPSSIEAFAQAELA